MTPRQVEKDDTKARDENADFHIDIVHEIHMLKPNLNTTDFVWLLRSLEKYMPLNSGYISTQVIDVLPLQRICYLDPITKSSTNYNVVRETLMRTLNITKNTNQSHGIVTYDLPVMLSNKGASIV